MSLEQFLLAGGLFVLILALAPSRRGSALRFWVGILLVVLAFRLYMGNDEVFDDLWRVVRELPGAVLVWLRSLTG
jgi:hypothetical protein